MSPSKSNIVEAVRALSTKQQEVLGGILDALTEYSSANSALRRTEIRSEAANAVNTLFILSEADKGEEPLASVDLGLRPLLVENDTIAPQTILDAVRLRRDEFALMVGNESLVKKIHEATDQIGHAEWSPESARAALREVFDPIIDVTGGAYPPLQRLEQYAEFAIKISALLKTYETAAGANAKALVRSEILKTYAEGL